MATTQMTPEIAGDLRLLQYRKFLDPKQFYKSTGKKKPPKFFQVGEIVEGASEFYSSRLTKRERKQTMVDEMIDNERLHSYAAKKMKEIQASRSKVQHIRHKKRGAKR
ncbi:putative Fcf2 pre-rRNA processing protein [Paratrimastix pyriformis]|uniref:Fcf2 pre-rRNA processing protein n=1 Tax=Paratrimastix pyriformis TaxID=342808 RepID=A0ABQ8UIQ9_9EUKA|nr:putative Fcf2 pre-rRNA processing protein [Paratrimastix pyriformis]